MSAAFSVMVFYIMGGVKEIVMCAVVRVMVCYSVVEREGNVDVCCS
jgi:hypothetical protein